jgi:acyl-coenzyme A synthetase/AMP-(fatty) acid ligase
VNDGLFVEGRVAHVIHTSTSVLTPVPIEQSVEEVMPGITAAAVGVSAGQHQALVVVLCDGKREGSADVHTEAKVRDVTPDVVAVLFKKELPVDRRHNSKIDRTALGLWVTKQLA